MNIVDFLRHYFVQFDECTDILPVNSAAGIITLKDNAKEHKTSCVWHLLR